MRGGGKLFMLAGVGLGLVAVVLAVMAFTGGGQRTPEAPTAAKPANVTVVETLRDVPAHTILTSEDVIEVNVPNTGLLPDTVRTKAEVIGLAYRLPLVKGQRLLAAQVEQPGLANDIAAGMRAMSVPVNAVGLLSGLIQDDDYIDIACKIRVNEVRLLGHVMGPTPEDEPSYKFGDDDGFGWVPIDIVDEFPPFPAAGDPGSQMFIRDDTGEDQQLEPVAKMLLQDVHVLRVVRPGESYGANGQPVVQPVVEGGSTGGPEEVPGYLIVEVSNQQAEVLTFLNDERYGCTNVVRGKGDHQRMSTTGITFEILATNPEWALPLPGSVVVEHDRTVPGGVTRTNDFDLTTDLTPGYYEPIAPNEADAPAEEQP